MVWTQHPERHLALITSHTLGDVSRAYNRLCFSNNLANNLCDLQKKDRAGQIARRICANLYTRLAPLLGYLSGQRPKFLWQIVAVVHLCGLSRLSRILQNQKLTWNQYAQLSVPHFPILGPGIDNRLM